jgi:oligoribonuclease NrnB/cAMP/cGMP phosphodiesterase (DHH superfamily)
MSDVHILYHQDADGNASAAILRKYLQASGNNVILRGLSHGARSGSLSVGSDDLIYLVDYAFQPLIAMSQFAQSHKNLVWIDHHANSIEYEEAIPSLKDVQGIRQQHFSDTEMTISACELTWQYCYPGTPIPPIIDLIGCYDTYRHVREHNDDALLLVNYLNSVNTAIHSRDGSLFWNDIMALSAEEQRLALEKTFLPEGRVCLRYSQSRAASVMRTASFEAKFLGISALIVNTSWAYSQFFNELYDHTVHQLMVAFTFKRDRWVVTLYSTHKEVNCAELARKMGGSGHPSAGGFTLKDFSDFERLLER